MSDTQQQNPDNQPGQPATMIPTREAVTDRQVETVLSVLGSLQPYLLLPSREYNNEKPELDGGAHSSAVVTFTKACDRLDAILADESRWKIKGSDRLYNAIIGAQRSVKKLHQAQTINALSLQRPCTIFRPQFAQMGDTFTAYYVSSDFPGGILIGRGATPQAALADFDKAFSRIPSEQLKFNEQSLAKIRAAGMEVRRKSEVKENPKKKNGKKVDPNK